MNIDNFFSEFSTESACKLYFKQQREAKGISCKKCKSTQHYLDKIFCDCFFSVVRSLLYDNDDVCK